MYLSSFHRHFYPESFSITSIRLNQVVEMGYFLTVSLFPSQSAHLTIWQAVLRIKLAFNIMKNIRMYQKLNQSPLCPPTSRKVWLDMMYFFGSSELVHIPGRKSAVENPTVWPFVSAVLGNCMARLGSQAGYITKFCCKLDCNRCIWFWTYVAESKCLPLF